MPETKYQEIEVRHLHPNKWNPNEMTDFQKKVLAGSLKSGDKQTILVRPCICEDISGEHFIIVDGEQRWNEARDSGINTLKSLVIEEDDKEAKLDTLRLNKIKGEANPTKLAGLIMDLQKNHHMTLNDISIQSGYTIPEIKIAQNKAKIKKEQNKQQLDVLKQLVILGTKEEIISIEQAMDKHKVKTNKEYTRNGTILAELCVGV